MTLASALVSNPTLFLGFVALLGLLVGSFINVIVYRLPIMLERAWQSSELPTEAFNLAVPRSHCPSCAQQLSAGENVPVVCQLCLSAPGRVASCQMSCLLKPSTSPFRVRTALLARSNLARVKMCPSSVSCFFADVAGTANPEYQPAILSLK